MRWPRSHQGEGAIEVRDDQTTWQSDFEEPLPPLTRNELLDRLGLDEALPSLLSSVTQMSDAEAMAAA